MALRFARVFVILTLVNSLYGLNLEESDNSLGAFGACANCAGGDLTQSQLTEVRLEFVKQQILKKLRLSKEPNLAMPVSLPMPVAQGQTLSQGTDKPPEFDNYYGRTEQKIIFPVEGELCFEFFF